MRRADIEVPNHPVDMDSWGRSACYPRGTFYPLSDGASTSHRRITSPDFRPCSTRRSHSQAPLCTYTQHLIANQAEGNLWAPPLLFRRQPPQLNYPSDTVPDPDHGPRLDIQHDQTGISTTTPLNWRPEFTVSQLSYTSRTEHQYQTVVKVPGSFRPAARNEHLYS